MYTLYMNSSIVVDNLEVDQARKLTTFLLCRVSGTKLVELEHNNGKTYTYSHNDKMFKPDDGQGGNL